MNLKIIHRDAQLEKSQKIIDRLKSKCSKFEAEVEEQGERLMDLEQNVIMKLKAKCADLENERTSRDEQLALMEQKNEALRERVDQAQDDSEAVQAKNDEIDELQNKMEAISQKLSDQQSKFTAKCTEFDEIVARCKKLEQEMDAKESKIGRLNLRVKEATSARMADDDETKLKLHQYNVQIITIEENKKLIEKLRNEVVC